MNDYRLHGVGQSISKKPFNCIYILQYRKPFRPPRHPPSPTDRSPTSKDKVKIITTPWTTRQTTQQPKPKV